MSAAYIFLDIFGLSLVFDNVQPEKDTGFCGILACRINPLSASQDCSRRHSLIFFHFFSEKIRCDVSSESSARQRIHMKNQALFSSKDKSKKLKCGLLQFMFGASRVNNLSGFQ